jgi:hypothetical protein
MQGFVRDTFVDPPTSINLPISEERYRIQAEAHQEGNKQEGRRFGLLEKALGHELMAILP